MHTPVVFEVVLADGHTEVVRGANAYVQEGPLTTFFSSPRSRAQIDSRSERLGSFRTTDIRRIVRRELDDVGLRAVPDGPDDGYGHYTFRAEAAGRGGGPAFIRNARPLQKNTGNALGADQAGG